MYAEVVPQRIGVGVDIPQQFGQHVFAWLHPRGHVVGSRALLKHKAHAVVVEVLQVGLQHMEIGERIPHVAELHHIVPHIDVVGQCCPILHIFAK